MKKVLITLMSLVAGASFVHAQGLVTISGRPGTGISTNTSSLYAEGSGSPVSGATFSRNTAGVAYYYALLIASSTTANDVSPIVGSDWSLATVDGTTPIVGTNFLNVAGSVQANGAAGGTPVQGWASGTTMNMMLVGWSANYGTSWAAVQALFGNGTQAGATWSTPGYFGWSSIGNITSGGPTPNPSVSVFSTGGFTTPFSLYATIVPEPTTLALAGLGGISMLFLRRRKA